MRKIFYLRGKLNLPCFRKYLRLLSYSECIIVQLFRQTAVTPIGYITINEFETQIKKKLEHASNLKEISISIEMYKLMNQIESEYLKSLARKTKMIKFKNTQDDIFKQRQDFIKAKKDKLR